VERVDRPPEIVDHVGGLARRTRRDRQAEHDAGRRRVQPRAVERDPARGAERQGGAA
jgi:hypothetical protein